MRRHFDLFQQKNGKPIEIGPNLSNTVLIKYLIKIRIYFNKNCLSNYIFFYKNCFWKDLGDFYPCESTLKTENAYF